MRPSDKDVMKSVVGYLALALGAASLLLLIGAIAGFAGLRDIGNLVWAFHAASIVMWVVAVLAFSGHHPASSLIMNIRLLKPYVSYRVYFSLNAAVVATMLALFSGLFLFSYDAQFKSRAGLIVFGAGWACLFYLSAVLLLWAAPPLEGSRSTYNNTNDV
jgi:hypothetical protein